MIFDSLQQYLVRKFPGCTVSEVEFMTSGFESDIYSFLFNRPGHATRSLVLRLYPGNDAAEKLAREANGLARLHQAGYPVPELLLYESDARALGQPFAIIEKLEGSALWPKLAGAEPAQAAKWLSRFGALLARLHSLDWRPFHPKAEAVEENPMLLIDEWLADLRRTYTRFDLPGFFPVAAWLESNFPADGVQPAVVHLDFHANNVFLCSDGSMAVLDWTQVGVFDYRADLSWTLHIMGEYGQKQWADAILKAYEASAGRVVGSLAYFNVTCYLKLLTSSVISHRRSMMDVGLNPKKAASLEAELPLLRLLSERVFEITGLKIEEVERLKGQV